MPATDEIALGGLAMSGDITMATKKITGLGDGSAAAGLYEIGWSMSSSEGGAAGSLYSVKCSITRPDEVVVSTKEIAVVS